VERPYHGNKKQILIGYDYFLKFSPMYPWCFGPIKLLSLDSAIRKTGRRRIFCLCGMDLKADLPLLTKDRVTFLCMWVLGKRHVLKNFWVLGLFPVWSNFSSMDRRRYFIYLFTLLLCWVRYIVAFTNHTWIHPLHHSPLSFLPPFLE
jgi:hypothetical protein